VGHHGDATVVVALPDRGGAVIARAWPAIAVLAIASTGARADEPQTAEPGTSATANQPAPDAPSPAAEPATPTTSPPAKDGDPTSSSPAKDAAPTTNPPGKDASTTPLGAREAPTQTSPLASKEASTPPTAPKSDDDGEPRLSLPTTADRTAWRTSGFRLGLGVAYGRFVGLRGAPSGRLIGPTIRAGVRLDDSWSILASFQYAAASERGGLSGLRFAGTIDPTWHVMPSLAVSLGFGFGGIVEGRTGRMDANPLPGTLDTSYTFPDARPPVASCSGVGAAGLARVEWAYVLGPRAQTGVALEVVGQWTGCVDDTNRVEPDTGTAIVRRQWWPHTGATIAWGVTWR
jgi:hypothetical protein